MNTIFDGENEFIQKTHCCENSDCDDSACEEGLDTRDLQEKYQGTKVFKHNNDGTLSFYVIDFDNGDAYLCELKTNNKITQRDNSKWEIKYVNVSDEETGVQKWSRAWNIQSSYYKYNPSCKYHVVVDFNPIMKKPNESSLFGGWRAEGLDFRCMFNDLIMNNM